MSFFEDAVIQDSVEIKATPEDVFNFITGIIDDNTYKAWPWQMLVGAAGPKGHFMKIWERN